MRMFMAVLLMSCPLLAKQKDVDRRLEDSATVLSEIMASPDKGIPEDLLEKAHCIVIVPGLKKGAFIVGGKYGKGFVSCRPKNDAGWSAPAAIRVEGGSFGFQIGGSETDVVMLVMNDSGADKLLSSEFTLGGEGEVAAGPVGRLLPQRQMPNSAQKYSRGRDRGVFSRELLFKEQRCGRISTTMRRSMASGSKTEKSSPSGLPHLPQPAS